MGMYMYTRVCVCVHECVCMGMYLCVQAHAYVHACMHVHGHAHVCVFECVCVCEESVNRTEQQETRQRDSESGMAFRLQPQGKKEFEGSALMDPRWIRRRLP